MNSSPLDDDEAREYIKRAVGRPIFVTAGAGAGKTETLVKRIVATIEDPTTDIGPENIVAITFTEKAASELRQRIARRLHERERGHMDVDEISTSVMYIGTIHSFAAGILRRFCLEATVPPGFVIATEAASRAAARIRARQVFDSLSAFKDSESILVEYAIPASETLRLLETVDAHPNWNSSQLSGAAVNWESERKLFLHELSVLMMQTEQAYRGPIGSGEDDLWIRIRTAYETLLQVSNWAEIDAAKTYSLWSSHRWHPDLFRFRNYGRTAHWSMVPKDIRDRWKSLGQHFQSLLALPAEIKLRELLIEASSLFAEHRDRRRKAGELEYDDLLVLALALVKENREVLRWLNARYQCIFVDEFQDTDPIQWQLVRGITDPASIADPEPEDFPGVLTLVGDPKQAIYSFRGADVEVFRAVQNEFLSGLGDSRHLTTNFRSAPEVLTWVNTTFKHALAGPAQVTYEAMNAQRDFVPGLGSVTLLEKVDQAESQSDKDIECGLIASAILGAVRSGLLVSQDSLEGTRPARFRDIAILFPTRTTLGALLNALDKVGIPYRSADARIVMDTAAVKGLVAAIRFIADSRDLASLWLLLKSPMFGISDAELARYKASGQRWWEEPSEANTGRVASALHLLRKLRKDASTLSPLEIVDALCSHTRIAETLSVTRHGPFERECLSMLRVRTVQWQTEEDGSLIDFIDFLDELANPTSRATFDAPASEEDAIQLMTVFGAKGLEFPIVMVAGMASAPRVEKPTAGLSSKDCVEFRWTSDLMSRGYAQWHDSENLPRILAERMRVLYVACTRARDHLFVSLVGSDSARATPAAMLAPFVDLSGVATRTQMDLELLEFVAPSNPPLVEDWPATLASVQELSGERWVVAPSGSANHAGESDQAEHDTVGEASAYSEDDEAQFKAERFRDGSATGQAFHWCMEQLLAPDGAFRNLNSRDLAEAAIQELSVTVDPIRLSEMIDSALRAPVVREALASQERWVELYLAAPTEDAGRMVLVEGFADLVFRNASGELTLVDYKTDHEIDEARHRHYKQQLGSYAEMLRKIAGELPSRIIVLHVRPGQTTELIC